MIRLKNKNDIIQIKKAIEIGEGVLNEIEKYISPDNRNVIDLDCLIGALIREKNAEPSFYGYKGFPGNACISINEEIIHGIPIYRDLKNGDIIKIDIGINYKGYFSDQARTYICGEIKDPRHYELINACQKALEVAASLAKQKYNLKVVSQNIEEIAKSYNLGILKDYTGHGVGFEIHEEPRIPNYTPYVDLELKSGMVLAIEPMFVLGKGNYNKSENNWTIITDGISAHEEKTIIIE